MITALRVGLITGAIITAYNFTLFFTGILNDTLANLDLVILIVAIVFAQKIYKKSNDGLMTYKWGVGIGVVVSAIAAFISRIFLYIQLEFIDDSLLGMITEQWRQTFINRGMSGEELEKAVAATVTTPAGFAFGNFQFFLVAGIIFSLIISVFFKIRKRNTVS